MAVDVVPSAGFVVSDFFFLGVRGFFTLTPADDFTSFGFSDAVGDDGDLGCCFCCC